MTDSTPTLPDVFAKRARLFADSAPLFAAVCDLVAADPELARAVADDSVKRASTATMWSRPHIFAGLLTRLLRGPARDHELAAYWPTLGGRRPLDSRFGEVFADLIARYGTELSASAARYPDSRANDPAAAAMLWPGIAWAASRVDGPVALLELGSAAGLCLYADRYGYRYGDTLIRGDARPVLECAADGDAPDHLDVEPDVVARIGLEYTPIRHTDADAISWLRDCVLPDDAAKLDDVDAAERLPLIFERYGRDLVWIAKEHADNALGLVADVPADLAGTSDTAPTVLLTAAEYRAGELTDVRILAEPDPRNAAITWNARPVTPHTAAALPDDRR